MGAAPVTLSGYQVGWRLSLRRQRGLQVFASARLVVNEFGQTTHRFLIQKCSNKNHRD